MDGQQNRRRRGAWAWLKEYERLIRTLEFAATAERIIKVCLIASGAGIIGSKLALLPDALWGFAFVLFAIAQIVLMLFVKCYSTYRVGKIKWQWIGMRSRLVEGFNNIALRTGEIQDLLAPKFSEGRQPWLAIEDTLGSIRNDINNVGVGFVEN